MKKFICLIVTVYFVTLTSYAQQTNRVVDYSYFFDNTEFAQSKFAVPQTMTGMHFAPYMNNQFAGKNSLKISGGMLEEYELVIKIQKIEFSGMMNCTCSF